MPTAEELKQAAESATAREAEAAELLEHPEQGIPAAALDGAVHDYPSEMHYWWVALGLALITGVEVSTYTHPSFWTGPFGSDVDILVPSLLFMMAVKFFTVTWAFMHLKNDSKLLTQIFYACLFLALAVYIATLLVFQFFT